MSTKYKNRDFIEFVYENVGNDEKCTIKVPEASKLSPEIRLRVAYGLFRMAKRCGNDLHCRIVLKRRDWGFKFYSPSETMVLSPEIFYNIISSHYKKTIDGGIYNVVFDGKPRVFKGPSFSVCVQDLDAVPEKVLREVSARHPELLHIENDAKFMKYLEELQQKQMDVEAATQKLQEEREAERALIDLAMQQIREMQEQQQKLIQMKKELVEKTIPETAYLPEMLPPSPPSTSESVPFPSCLDAQEVWNLLGCSSNFQGPCAFPPGPSAETVRNQIQFVTDQIFREVEHEQSFEHDEQESLFDLDAALAGEGYEDARSDLEPYCASPQTENDLLSELIKVALDDYQSHQMTYEEAKEFLDSVKDAQLDRAGEEMDEVAKIEINQAVARLRYLHFGMVDPEMPKSVYQIGYGTAPDYSVEVEHDFDDGASVSTAIEPEPEVQKKEVPNIRSRKSLYKKKRGEVMKKYKEIEWKNNKKFLDRIRKYSALVNCPCNSKTETVKIEVGTSPEGESFKNDQYREIHLDDDYRYIPEKTEVVVKEESDMESAGTWCPHVNYPVYNKVLRMAIWDFQDGDIIDPALVVLKSHNVKAIIPHTPDISVNMACNNGIFDLQLSFVATSDSADANAVVQIVDLGYEKPRPISNYIYLWHCGPYTKPLLEDKTKMIHTFRENRIIPEFHINCTAECGHDLPEQQTFMRIWSYEQQPSYNSLNECEQLNKYYDFYTPDNSLPQTVQKLRKCCQCSGPCKCQQRIISENGNDAEYPYMDTLLYGFAGAEGDFRRLPSYCNDLVTLTESDLEPVGLWCSHVPLPVFRKMLAVSIAPGSLEANGWSLSLVRHNNIQAVTPGEATVTPEYIMDFRTEKCYDVELFVVVQDLTKDAYAVCQFVYQGGSRVDTLSSYLYIWYDAKQRQNRANWMGYEPHPLPSAYHIAECSEHCVHPYPKLERFQQFFPQMCEYETFFEHPESDKEESEPEIEDDKESTVTAIEPEEQEIDGEVPENEDDKESTVTAIEPEEQEIDEPLNEDDNESTVTAIEPEEQELDEFERVEASIVDYSDTDESDDDAELERAMADMLIDAEDDRESVATAIEPEENVEDDLNESFDDCESFKTVAEHNEDEEAQFYHCRLCSAKFLDFEDFIPHMVAHVRMEEAAKREYENPVAVAEAVEEAPAGTSESSDDFSLVTEHDLLSSPSNSNEGSGAVSDFVGSTDGSDFEIINESDDDY